MSIATQHPTAVRRLREGVLAVVAALAAVATVVFLLTALWLLALASLAVLLLSTTWFWQLVERAPRPRRLPAGTGATARAALPAAGVTATSAPVTTP